MSKSAHILALNSATLLHTIGLGFGIRAITEFDEQMIFNKRAVYAVPREVAEYSPAFIQPIPYICIRDGDRYLSYPRTKKGNENRLHDKVTLGANGHVDARDAVYDEDGMIDVRRTIQIGALREMSEELGLKLPSDILDKQPDLLRWTYVIQSQADAVSGVHLGLVCTIDRQVLDQYGEFDFENTVGEAAFLTAAELLGRHTQPGKQLEVWAKLILEAQTDR